MLTHTDGTPSPMILTQSGTSGTANVPPGLKLKTGRSVSMGGNEKEMRQSSGVDGQPWDTRHMLKNDL